MNIRGRLMAGKGRRKGKKQDAPVIMEADFQSEIMKLAAELGWQSYHIPDSRRATSNGFPDLVLRHDVRHPYLVAIELKRRGGKMRDGQVQWITAFRRAGVCCGVAYPDEIQEVLAILSGELVISRERMWYA